MSSTTQFDSPTILRDFSIRLTAIDLAQAYSRGRQSSLPPALMEASQTAVDMCHDLIEPAVIYDRFQVYEVGDGKVTLGKEGPTAPELHYLHVGPKVDLLAPAQQVIVSVITIGPALENKVHQLENKLVAFMLDTAGVLALSTVGETLRDRIEQQVAASQWGVSPALAPGSLVGWQITGQREVTALLPLEEIGVRLTEYCVLEPHKSASMTVGLGSDYSSSHIDSVCQYCSLAAHCWRRWGNTGG
jgi:hypothetical protein